MKRMSHMPEWMFEIWTNAQANDARAVREAIAWYDIRGRVVGFVKPDGRRVRSFEDAFKAWKDMHKEAVAA